jgi:proteasome assembly chaperone (PAC2) family protein
VNLVIVTGDSQPSTSEGYFAIAQEILAEAQAGVGADQLDIGAVVGRGDPDGL